MINDIFKSKFNNWVKQEKQFFFLIDFEQEQPLIFSPEEAFKQNVFFDINGNINFNSYSHQVKKNSFNLDFNPIAKDFFESSFNSVQKHLQAGNTYLLNLTFQIPLNINFSLEKIFFKAKAPYKVYFRDKFVCFSPETFVKTRGNKIATYPMKGTINADLPDAKELLLNNKKEYYEHNTIVDLLRNDLAIVASNVQVKKFRYIDKIYSSTHNLLQASSEIIATLPNNWRQNAVEIFEKLLPAGSISGAPKQKTVEIIHKVEQTKRGYYTGIAGFFDGNDFDTAVLIRFIEQKQKRLFYRTGGGITALSQIEDEYNELIQKIYVPSN